MSKIEVEITQPGVTIDGEDAEKDSVIKVACKDGKLPAFLVGKAKIVSKGGKSAVTNPKRPNKAAMLKALKEADITVDADAKMPEISGLYDELINGAG